MLRSLLLYLSERESPKKLLIGNPLGRRLASRFIAGEEVDDALRVIRRLNSEGFMVTLDYLGESVQRSRCRRSRLPNLPSASRSARGGEAGLARLREAHAIGLGD